MGLKCFAPPFPLSPGHAAVVLGPVKTDTSLLGVCIPCCVLLGVVAQNLKLVKLLAICKCWELLANNVVSVCTGL